MFLVQSSNKKVVISKLLLIHKKHKKKKRSEKNSRQDTFGVRSHHFLKLLSYFQLIKIISKVTS